MKKQSSARALPKSSAADHLEFMWVVRHQLAIQYLLKACKDMTPTGTRIIHE